MTLAQFSKYPYSERAYIYAQHVVNGHRLASHTERLACQRFLDDLEREDFRYTYNFELAENVCGFIEELPHTKGVWASRRELITLEGWQCFALCNIFGWVDEHMLRRFREVYIKVPRKNGKSIICGAIGIYMLTCDGEHGAEVYCGATTEIQAKEVFVPAQQMCLRSPELAEELGVEVHAKSIIVRDTASKFERLIGNPGDGSSPSLAIIDEYHEHDTDNQVSTMETGMLARAQPLMIKITTAGNNSAGPCAMAEKRYKDVLLGVHENERAFILIYGIDEDDDWTSEDALIKANPNYGVSVSAEMLRESQQQAIAWPEKQNDFRRKHLNIWVGSLEAFFNMENYLKCEDTTLRAEDFNGCESVITVDLASKIDLAAMVRLYRRIIDAEIHYYCFPTFYAPHEVVHDEKNTHYQAWANAGWLTVTDGDEIDFNLIEHNILASHEDDPCIEFVYDPWQATQLKQKLEEQYGMVCVEYRQTAKMHNPPMREAEAAINSGRLHTNGNPIMAWCIENVTAKEDPGGNVFPRKERVENKIDGAVALLMGIGRLMLAPDTGLDDFLSEANT